MATCTDIGYTERVAIVFQAKLKKEKAEEFPFYEEGNMNGAKFVDGQIALFESGGVSKCGIYTINGRNGEGSKCWAY